MRKFSSTARILLFLGLLLSLAILAGCPKKADVMAIPEEQTQPEQPPEAEKPRVEPEAQKPQEPQQPRESAEDAEARERAAAEKAAGLSPVYYDFDQSFIRSDATDIMRKNAEWLKAQPKAKIRIEAHCDERGTIEYNQALGQRRATAAKKYLVDLGVSAGRISLISYGKEKPVCGESSEDCLQRNRRSDFVVVSE